MEVATFLLRVDYLKYDNCFNDGTPPKVRYPIMRDALNSTGRHIFFSMCQWGEPEYPWLWATPVSNSWRTSSDINGLFITMLSILDQQRGLSKYSGPGAWNDPDML
jgi:alpha-galactosidase